MPLSRKSPCRCMNARSFESISTCTSYTSFQHVVASIADLVAFRKWPWLANGAGPVIQRSLLSPRATSGRAMEQSPGEQARAGRVCTGLLMGTYSAKCVDSCLRGSAQGVAVRLKRAFTLRPPPRATAGHACVSTTLTYIWARMTSSSFRRSAEKPLIPSAVFSVAQASSFMRNRKLGSLMSILSPW